MADVLFTLLEFGFIVLGGYCIYRGLRSMRALAQASSHDALWQGYLRVLGFSLGGALVLGMNALLGGRTADVVLVALTLSTVVFIAASVIAWVRYRRIEGGGRLPVRGASAKARKVVIRALKPQRVRGLVNGEGVVLTRDDETSIAGTAGFVKMIPWDSALKARDSQGFIPLLGFWDGEGTELLLYADDKLELAPQG